MKLKTIEQRLFEAYLTGSDLQLSAEDVESLMLDDAIGTRVTNQACIEAGVPEAGFDDTWKAGVKSWRGFVKAQKKKR